MVLVQYFLQLLLQVEVVAVQMLEVTMVALQKMVVLVVELVLQDHHPHRHQDQEVQVILHL
jgi:hypothetical protein